MLKVAVVGSRSIMDYHWVRSHLERFRTEHGDFAVVSGGASGVDSIASIWAKDNSLPSEVYFPKYQLYGRQAPLERNHEIVEAADLVLAFRDGKSTGTRHTVGLARKAGKREELAQPETNPVLLISMQELPPSPSFGLCYECEDGLHDSCIGVPCQCECPIKASAAREAGQR